MKSFAQALRSARKRAGLTQKELAATVGIDDSYISRMERDSSPAPDRAKVMAIANALQINLPAERARFLQAANRLHLSDLIGVPGDEAAEISAESTGEHLITSMTLSNTLEPQDEKLIQRLQWILANAGYQRAEIRQSLASFFRLGRVPDHWTRSPH